MGMGRVGRGDGMSDDVVHLSTRGSRDVRHEVTFVSTGLAQLDDKVCYNAQ